MSRYIDADALAKKLTDWSTGTVEPIDWSDIAEAPSIDIVRCKECKHGVSANFVREPYLLCRQWSDVDNGRTVKPDDFCSYGEREGE